MNLYRSFGNLLESWVTEGFPDQEPQASPGLIRLESLAEDHVPLFRGKSESEDSGVETVSTTSPCHSHQCSTLISVESQPSQDTSCDGAQPSPPCSSSSSCVSLDSVTPKKSCLEIDPALRWTESSSGHLPLMEQGSPGPRKRSNTASFPTSGHSSGSRPLVSHRVSRTRRTHSQPPDHKKAELYRRHHEAKQHDQIKKIQLEVSGGDEEDKLSPGLLYLEQVCRMLENIAKLQQQNQSLQVQLETLKIQKAEKESFSLPEEEINYPDSQILEILGHEDAVGLQTFPKDPLGFRHRSVSDTQAIVGRHRRSKYTQEEPLNEMVEDQHAKDHLPDIKSKKQSKFRKLKLTSFRKPESATENSRSQSTRKAKLPNIFKNRRMTTRL